MKQLISAAAMGAVVLALATSSAMALTFKKGQVLGSDGKIYDGASPEETARLIKNAADGGESAGVRGNNLFVVMDDELVFIPLSDLSGKTKETRMDIVKAHVIANATDLDVDELLEEAGNLEAVLESRLAGIEAGDRLLGHLDNIAAARGWPVMRWITQDNNYRARGLYDQLALRTGWITYDMNAETTGRPDR